MIRCARRRKRRRPGSSPGLRRIFDPASREIFPTARSVALFLDAAFGLGVLRFLGPLGAVLFVDSSDVRSGRVDYSLGTPHLAPGVGLRYPTPVGPVRLDLGFRVLEALGREAPVGTPPEVFGAPMTLSLAVGQAF